MRRFVLPFLFVAFLFATLYARRPEPSLSPVEEETVWEFEGQAMGTSYHVKMVPDERLQNMGPEGFAAAGENAIQEVNAKLSTYSESSELSRFNRLESTEAVRISTDFRMVLEEALRIHKASLGAFDVTIGPLVNLWGFGPKKDREPPTEGEIAKARESVGSHFLVLGQGEASELAKSRTDVYVDLSAIAKGFGVDRMADALAAMGAKNLLVEVGGEVVTRGKGPGGRPWRVGLEIPNPGETGVESTIALDGALATSGNYRNYRLVDGIPVGHTLDARSGQPVVHRTASVSVFAEHCMKADGWATALLVLGSEEGLKVAEAQGIAARFLVARPAGGFSAVVSRKWKERFGNASLTGENGEGEPR